MLRSTLESICYRLLLSLLIALTMSNCATRGTASLGSTAAAKSMEKKAGSVAPTLGKKFWVSHDGEKFPITRWGGKSKPETVIVAVHGLSGAASDFAPLGEYFQDRSTSVYSYALRGQGNDPRKDKVGDIKDPELWYEDLDTFLTLVRAENPNARLFLYGESLGGLISLYGMEALSGENRDAIRGVILSSPVVSLKDRESVSRLRYAILKSAITLMPRRKISLERLAADKEDMHITGDADHRENVRGTPHAVDKFSFRLLGTLEKLIDGSRAQAAKIRKPILVLYPAHDLLTTPEDVEDWFGALETEDKEKYLFAKSYHLLLHDKERESVLERVRAWLERH
ncbi:MAG: acylglycerol lipase [Verrucomicrobiales bacterium]|jgi:acylglycerol lipase